MLHLLRRLALYIFITWAALTLNFIIPRLVPGDPIDQMLTRSQGQLEPGAIAALRKAYGLTDEPLPRQYLDYLGQLAHGDLGLSISKFPVPVSQIISAALPWTVGLVGVTTVISFLLGTGLGVLLGWKRGRWSDAALPAMTFFNALPYFWVALMLVLFLAIKFPLFPSSLGFDQSLTAGLSWPFIRSVIAHAALPAFTIIISSVAGWALGMRNMTVMVLGEDYVHLAEAKGLRQRTIMFRYAARNALLPSITSFALALGGVVGGSVLTESIFNYPGVGYELVAAVQAQDYPLMQGLFLIVSIAVIIANLLADILYVLLDPRTRDEARA